MKRVARFRSLAFTFLIGSFIVVPLTYGRGSFPSTWSDIYPVSQSDDNAASVSVCYLCHTPDGNSTWNPYGNAIKRNMDSGMSLSEAVVAVENDNSDGDPPVLPQLPEGWTNILEITWGGQPGWSTGQNNSYDGDGNVIGTMTAPAGIGSLDPDLVDAVPVSWGRLKTTFPK
jgi:hypothetical protein